MTGRELSVKEAAGRLGVSPRTVYRWVQRGRLSGRKMHGKTMVNFEAQASPLTPVPLATQEDVPVTVPSPVTTAALPAASCPATSNSCSPQRDLVFNWRS